RSPSKITRRLGMTPLAARKLTTWIRFMYGYALGLVPDAPYVFRNGARMRIGRGVDHVPLIEIFLREDYGSVADGAVVLDLGANIGTFAVYAGTTAKRVTVYAYEPMSEFYRLLQDNIRLNHLEDAVRCFNRAVSSDSSERELVVSGPKVFFPTFFPQDRENSGSAVRVQCTTLAEIIDTNKLQRFDLLKMDCEGDEYDILYATPKAYFDRIAEIRLEYHNLAGERRNVDSLTDFLRQVGYEVTVAKSANTDQMSGNLRAYR
ncbi:MAG TPA: FkbM family methyltransferase, partial [Nitrospira sp.]|nr:FkbM family methyltransferase [Nitrospira sp.]